MFPRIHLLKSRVGRRIAIPLILGIAVPIGLSVLIPLHRVSQHLISQSQERRAALCKALSSGLGDRLEIVAADFDHLTTSVRSARLESLGDPSFWRGLEERNGGRLKIVACRFGGESHVFDETLASSVASLDEIGATLNGRGPDGHAQLHVLDGASSGSGRPIFLARRYGAGDSSAGTAMLIARVDGEFLWSKLAAGHGDASHVAIVDANGEAIFSDLPDSEREAFESWVSRFREPRSSESRSSAGADHYFTSLPVFSDTDPFQPDWRITVFEKRAEVLSPIFELTWTFLLIMAICLIVVTLMSVLHIRRAMQPLQALKSGTEGLAGGNLGERVEIDTGDELEDVARSFNAMADRLQSHLGALETIGELVELVLSSLDRGAIVEAVLDRLPRVLPTREVHLILRNPQSGALCELYRRDSSSGVTAKLTLPLGDEASRVLHSGQRVLTWRSRGDLPEFLQPLRNGNDGWFMVLPIQTQDDMLGMICMRFSGAVELTDALKAQARHLADQVAVAIANALLIDAMDQMSIGAMTALARTVDAKSSWTSGHSERVTAMAMDIARVLQLTHPEQETIRRGCLLHDVGKIGVPNEVLDKPGALTLDEFEMMKQHPVIGANILEPLGAFKRLIPIVRHHHERFDGKGYPDGLAGEEIRFDVRVASVADVYDALASNRPYRPGMARSRVVKMIRDGAGTQFDPVVVEAFLELMRRRSGAVRPAVAPQETDSQAGEKQPENVKKPEETLVT